jgi:hypothetical protein
VESRSTGVGIDAGLLASAASSIACGSETPGVGGRWKRGVGNSRLQSVGGAGGSVK